MNNNEFINLWYQDVIKNENLEINFNDISITNRNSSPTIIIGDISLEYLIKIANNDNFDIIFQSKFYLKVFFFCRFKKIILKFIIKDY